MGWAGHVERMGEIRNTYDILVGRPDGKRQLGRHKHRWESNIIIELRDTGWEGVNSVSGHWE